MEQQDTYQRLETHCGCRCNKHCGYSCMTDGCDCTECNCLDCRSKYIIGGKILGNDDLY
jgi:hypothetical protein